MSYRRQREAIHIRTIMQSKSMEIENKIYNYNSNLNHIWKHYTVIFQITEGQVN